MLKEELNKQYYIELKQFLNKEYASKVIYPPQKDVFRAFDLTDYNHVKVVIIGQDPYHGFGQAHGLSFSVKVGVSIPRSLKNIYKELKNTLGCKIAPHGNLTKWAQQGVLLLNSVLTVEAGNPNSHRNRGWEKLTNKAIELLNEKEQPLVFMLWGNNARKKSCLITNKKHLVLQAAHPSPLSASRGFFGCNHFKLANDFLINNNKSSIDWCIT